MRNHGTCFELLRLRPNDHIGWVFSGPDQFAHLASPFLAEGASLNERLMYVAPDPNPGSLADLVDVISDRDALQVASITEVYGSTGVVDASSQRATFVEVLREALADGYSGIRVAADNSSLVLDPERLEAWIGWEFVADRFMSENPVTGLCAFDQQLVDVDTLRHLATLHPLCSAAEPVPQFRLFSDGDSLYVEGEMDTFAVDQVWLALRHLPPKTEVVVDLTKTTFLSEAVPSALHRLSEAGAAVVVRGPAETIEHLGESAGLPEVHFSVVDVS